MSWKRLTSGRVSGVQMSTTALLMRRRLGRTGLSQACSRFLDITPGSDNETLALNELNYPPGLRALAVWT